MFFAAPFDLPGMFRELLTLSDSTFYHLLGIVTVVSFLRIFLPLHSIMSKELFKRNEITDLAEQEMCTEYDIFMQAFISYYGCLQLDRIKRDFIVYLKSWPDNYILPFYLRIFLEDLNRNSNDSRPDRPADPIKGLAENLPGSSVP